MNGDLGEFFDHSVRMGVTRGGISSCFWWFSRVIGGLFGVNEGVF